MHIPIKPLKQPTEKDCSLTCLKMVLDYYGDNLQWDSLNNLISKSPEGWVYMVETARFIHERGLKVDCYSYNLYYADPKYNELDRDELIKILESNRSIANVDNWYVLRIEATIRAVQGGINYKIQRPTIQVISSYLKRKIPIICATSYYALIGEQGDPYQGHDIVLSGIDRNNIYYIDPQDALEKVIDIEHLIFAITSRKTTVTSAYMIAVMK
jgi:hypothetical protein